MINNHEVIYRGAIDNWFYELGRYRLEITDHYLIDAINASLDGKKPALTKTEALGCFIQRSEKEDRALTSLDSATELLNSTMARKITLLLFFFTSNGWTFGQDKPTYHTDIEPILLKNCVSCHKPGGIWSVQSSNI